MDYAIERIVESVHVTFGMTRLDRQRKDDKADYEFMNTRLSRCVIMLINSNRH